MPEILIVDDHPSVRQGVKQFISEEMPGAVFAEAETAGDALRQLLKRRFRVIVLDLSLPGRGGLEFVSEVHRAYPKIPILIFSFHPEEECAVRALRAGASGYVNKASGREELLGALRRVMAGEKYISPALAQKLALEKALPRRNDILSNREYEILRAIAEGKSLTAIARGLSLSVKTVSTHKRRTMSKLDLPNDAALIRYALEHVLGGAPADGYDARRA